MEEDGASLEVESSPGNNKEAAAEARTETETRREIEGISN